MIMSRRISYKVFLTVAVLLAACAGVSAQETAYSAYSPYSIFGVGDLSRQGTAYNRSMGGVGVALRSNRFINIVNPAAVTARDSLAFMADFGIYGDNKVFSQENIKSVNNTFNIGSLAMSFPIWRSSAMMIGITPYSDTGFGSSFKDTDPDVIGNLGNINFTAGGNGSIYKFFAAAGVTFFDRLSLGAEVDYYFGKISKTYDTSISDASYVSISNNTTLQMTAVGGKFGIQYEQPIGDEARLGVGATYSTSANLRGYYQDSRLSVGSAVTDTLKFSVDTLGLQRKVSLAPEIGVGVSFRYADRLTLAFDYSWSDWTATGIGTLSGFSETSSPFSASKTESYRFGMEFVPNRNDIRYYLNRVAYRVGAYYKNDYFLLNGEKVPSMGVTLGATFPIFRLYNGLTVGLEFGQRGSLKNSMVRERYFNFSVGVNIFDIWFQKPQYD